MKRNKKTNIIFGILLVLSLVLIIPINNGKSFIQSFANVFMGPNDPNYNKLKVVSADIVSRTTGSTPFDTPSKESVDDGSILSDNNGNDVSLNDLYVRTHDVLNYTIEVEINRNDATTDPDFYTTGGYINGDVCNIDNAYFTFDTQSWMEYGSFNSNTKCYTFTFTMPKNSSTVGALQRLTFQFTMGNRDVLLDDSKKPVFRFWMDGNRQDGNFIVNPVSVTDTDDIKITGTNSFTFNLKNGNVKYKGEYNGIVGTFVNFGTFVFATNKNSNIPNYKGVKIPSNDIVSTFNYTLKYRNTDVSNSFVKITRDTEDGIRVLDNIKIVAYGLLGKNTPGFVPREDLNIVDNKMGERIENGIVVASGGDVTASIDTNLQKIYITNSNYFTNKPFSNSDYYQFINDGIELFIPHLTEGSNNYDYELSISTDHVSEVNDNNEELYHQNNNFGQNQRFNSSPVENISYSMGYNSNDLLTLSTANNASFSTFVNLTLDSGPYLGGADTIIAWNPSKATFSRLDITLTNLPTKTEQIYYGIYKNNNELGLSDDDKINAAVYEDFDWYSDKNEALTHGAITALYVNSPDLVGFGCTEKLGVYFNSIKSAENYDVSSIIRRKTRVYKDAERTQQTKIGYDTVYIKAYIDDNGAIVDGSPVATGDTIYYPKYKTSTTFSVQDFNTGNSRTNFNVNDEFIRIRVTPSIELNSEAASSLTDDFHVELVLPKVFNYVENGFSVTPSDIDDSDSTYRKYIWNFENWRIGDPLPTIDVVVEISPYIANNYRATVITTIYGGSEPSNYHRVVGNVYMHGSGRQSSFGISNLAGQSIRKKVDKMTIGEDEDVSFGDYFYNISQETLSNVNTFFELPYNNDSNGSSYQGTYKIKVKNRTAGVKTYYTKASIESLNIPKDSHDRYLVKNIDYANDDRWIEISDGEYVPSDATAVGSHYDLLAVNSDYNYDYLLEEENNEIGDRLCMMTYGASTNLENAIKSDNKCVFIVNRVIDGYLFESINNNDYITSTTSVRLKNHTIILLDSNKQEVDRTTTDDNGYYKFDNLPFGKYYIKYEKDSHYNFAMKSTTESYNKINDNGLSDEIDSLGNSYELNPHVTVNIGIKKKRYNLTVHYYLENTTTSMDNDFTASYIYNTEYVAPSSNNIPNKYEVKSIVGSTNGPISEDTEVIYYYGLKNSKVIVKYIDKDTNTSIVTDDEYNKKYDDTYSVSPKTFEHYNYDSKEGDESGTLESDQVIVKYFYTKKPATLTVHHYYDGTTNSICDDVVDTNKHHTDPYTTSACTTIPNNYEFKNVVGTTNGTINSDSIIVTYYYQKKNSTISNTVTKTGDDTLTVYGNKVKYKLSIKHEVTDYIGNGTLTIVDTLPYHIDESTSTLDGGIYNSTDKTITWTIPINNIDSFSETGGKYLVNVEKNIELKYSDLNPKNRSMINTVNSSLVLDNNSTSKSSEKTTSIAIKGKIKVKYIDDEGNEIIPSINGEELVGTVFTAEAKEFTGYILKERPTNESVEYTVEDQELVYKYEHIKYNVIIVANNDGGTVEGNEVVFYGEDSSDGKLKIVVNEGYVIKSITINGETINVDNKREIILDRFTNMLEDKIIEVSFEQVVSSPNTESNSYIKIIAIGLIIITSYFILKKRKELFNK